MPYLGVHGLSYWALARASPPLLRAIHSRQMESVGGLFCTSWSPSHGSTTSASTARAWWAPGTDCTTNTHTRGYFCCSAYDSYGSTSCAYYIRAYHYHIGFGVSHPCAYLLDTHHHPFCSLPTDGWDTCPSRPANCYSPPDSAAPQSPAFALAWPSLILSAYTTPAEVRIAPP